MTTAAGAEPGSDPVTPRGSSRRLAVAQTGQRQRLRNPARRCRQQPVDVAPDLHRFGAEAAGERRRRQVRGAAAQGDRAAVSVAGDEARHQHHLVVAASLPAAANPLARGLEVELGIASATALVSHHQLGAVDGGGAQTGGLERRRHQRQGETLAGGETAVSTFCLPEP